MENSTEVVRLMTEAPMMDELENKGVAEASEPESKSQPKYIPPPMMLRHERQLKPAPTHRVNKKGQTRYWAKKEDSDSEYREEDRGSEEDWDEVTLPFRPKNPDASDDEGQIC
ncbi:hypothetical protein N7475_002431 [Penicillium sp. IBT 31633x]|nr:hypothetical protein N7475_002431 [Penicillium sp. IBT 31633x]